MICIDVVNQNMTHAGGAGILSNGLVTREEDHRESAHIFSNVDEKE